MRRSHPSRGFTLVEMLLVVAIISMLIAILLPTLSKTKHNALTVVCQTNLSYIYQATVRYTQEFNRHLPASRAWVGGDWSNINSVRTGTLYKFMGSNEGAYICPVFVGTPRTIWANGEGGYYYQNGRVAAFTYSLNEFVGNEWGSGRILRTLNRMEDAAGTLLYSDENPWVIQGLSTHPINNGAMGVGGWGPAGGDVDCIGSYHHPPGGNWKDGKSNVLFVDGHVDLHHVSKSKELVIPRRFRP